MKVVYNFFIMMLVISTMTSCGESTGETSKVKEVILKATQIEIKGDLKGCYEVVDKDYKVKFAQKSYEDDVVNVELKRTTKELPYDRKNVVNFPEANQSSAEYCAGFGIEILNADGDVIDKINANAVPYSWDEMTVALQLLPDETTTIAFHLEDLSEATGFRITSLVQENEEKKTSVGSEINTMVDLVNEAAELSEEVSVAEENANPKYDKVLDKLEKDVKKLNEMASKIGDGYGVLDITELQNKMQKDIDELKVEELSRNQRSRYDKIILNMTKATAVTAGGMMNVLF